jgi:hypothetical protein
MDHFAGLDVSVKATSVCIVDDAGKVVRVTSEPEALLAVLKNPAYHFTRIGLEAGPLSHWLFSALAEAELPVVCVETRHMQAVRSSLGDLLAAGRCSAPGAFSELRIDTTSQQLGCHGFLICGFRAYLFPARQDPPSREPNHLTG